MNLADAAHSAAGGLGILIGVGVVALILMIAATHKRK